MNVATVNDVFRFTFDAFLPKCICDTLKVVTAGPVDVRYVAFFKRQWQMLWIEYLYFTF